MAVTARAGGPQRVVVIGASLAGSLAAVAAAGAGRAVTVLERDVLPEDPQPRPGVPQGTQPHVFLYRGLLALEELVPGLRQELLGLGAVPFDTGDLAWLGEHGWLPTGQYAFEVLSATRPLLEHVVRRRTAAVPGVDIRAGVRVAGLRRSGAGWEVVLADGSTVPADLVVDASGRSSRLPAWLAEVGVSPARTFQVDAKVGYATRTYAADPGLVGAPGIVLLATPETLTGGIALPVEGGRWLVGAVGFGDCRPSRDPAEFESFLAHLRDPALADLVRVATPVSDVAVHRQTSNRRHHYEQVRDWPDGLLAVGDALCAFDPIYGQGVTVAAGQALLLRRALAGPMRPGSAHRLLRQFAAVTALPWALATGEDLRFPTSAGSQPLPQAMLGRWARQLGRLAVHGDPRAYAALSRVYHLVGSPALLFHPALVAAAAQAQLTGYGPPAPRPPSLRPITARAPGRAAQAEG